MGVPRVKRNFHNMAPAKFHTLNQRIKTALTDNPAIPDSTWGGNIALLTSFMTQSGKYDEVYHRAAYGSRLDIAERDVLQAALVILMDEMASLLDAASIRKPEILLSCGFDLTKERRTGARSKMPLRTSEDLKGDHAE